MIHRVYIHGLAAAALLLTRTNEALAFDCVEDEECEIGFNCEAPGDGQCPAPCGPYDFNCNPAEPQANAQHCCVARECLCDVDAAEPGRCNPNAVDAASVADGAAPPTGLDAAASDLDAEARAARPSAVGCGLSNASQRPSASGWLWAVAALALVRLWPDLTMRVLTAARRGE